MVCDGIPNLSSKYSFASRWKSVYQFFFCGMEKSCWRENAEHRHYKWLAHGNGENCFGTWMNVWDADRTEAWEIGKKCFIKRFEGNLHYCYVLVYLHIVYHSDKFIFTRGFMPTIKRFSVLLAAFPPNEWMCVRVSVHLLKIYSAFESPIIFFSS